MKESQKYDPITDWSQPARVALYQERRLEIELLLDEAFTEFVEKEHISLSRFGFRGDDPVSSAVGFCVERFVEGDLDPEEIYAESHSFRLFTEVRFWLAQKVGKQAYSRIIAEHGYRIPFGEHTGADPSYGSTEDELLFRFSEKLGSTLKTLRHMTCSGMVTYWLIGKEKMLINMGVKVEAIALEKTPNILNPKKRTLHIADAMFRFLVFYETKIDIESPDKELQACFRTWFQPCENSPPYRVKARDVREVMSLPGTRKTRNLRKQGISELLRRQLEIGQDFDGDLSDSFHGLLAKTSLRPTVLESYKIEDTDLRRSLRQLSGKDAQ